ncbi:polynucleotide 5'-hydroxyl-kinase NOL9 [Hyla sarda]|uniref:polynucleotide 5'-hydroxyl-kinase NOL9 n=1 Tax=Hyla sarda TaxID=327740 RepID=UPI0024C3E83C|nr:polynucleotide 5'-hydroxyl-kinase NOL9 [Hyla sarda]
MNSSYPWVCRPCPLSDLIESYLPRDTCGRPLRCTIQTRWCGGAGLAPLRAMKQRPDSARPGPSYKIRPGKKGSVRSRNALAERCKLEAASETRKSRSGPEESGEHGPEHGGSALLVEEGVCVTVLRPGEKLTFIGKCVLTCLYGSVKVLGLTINSNETPHELFSPKTHAPLAIEGLKQKKKFKTRKEIRAEARTLLRGYLSLDCRRAIMKKFKSSCSILLLERLEDTTVNYILSHPEYAKIFGTKLKGMQSSPESDPVLQSIGVYRCDPETAVSVSEETASAAQHLVSACLEEDNGCPIILVCGPKNVGKSTFNRYLINQLLQHIPCIDYLDCDLGQTEFTPPGCISLIRITKPVLGPPYTQQREPYKMVYFGETSCEQDMERFIESVKYVIASYKRDQPLIINTMGWVKGFGLLLLIDLIRLLSPSHIIQMFTADKNLMEPLTPEYVKNSGGYMTKSQSQAKCKSRSLDFLEEELADYSNQHHSRAPGGHHLFQIESKFDRAGDTDNIPCQNWILRDLAMLGYISKLQQFDPDQIIPLNALLPYEVPFNAVGLRVIHADVAPSHIMYSANASWVGLCHILDDISGQDSGPVLLTQAPICDCVGFGIIRGVDMEKKIYHLLTPLPPETLRQVNCLLIGNISIPHCVFKHQPGVQGDLPYVTTEYDLSVYGSKKMKLKKHLKRREHQ